MSRVFTVLVLMDPDVLILPTTSSSTEGLGLFSPINALTNVKDCGLLTDPTFDVIAFENIAFELEIRLVVMFDMDAFEQVRVLRIVAFDPIITCALAFENVPLEPVTYEIVAYAALMVDCATILENVAFDPVIELLLTIFKNVKLVPDIDGLKIFENVALVPVTVGATIFEKFAFDPFKRPLLIILE